MSIIKLMIELITNVNIEVERFIIKPIFFDVLA